MADIIAAWQQERDEWVRLLRDIGQEMHAGRSLTEPERAVVDSAIARVDVLNAAMRAAVGAGTVVFGAIGIASVVLVPAPALVAASVTPVPAPAPAPTLASTPAPAPAPPARRRRRWRHRQKPAPWRPPSPPVALTDEDCWRQAVSWQEDEPNGHERHRVRVYHDHDPDHCFACGSRDVAWNGQAWWCNVCDAIVEPDDPTESYVFVYDVSLPAFPYPVAPFDQDDADYREATALFRAGAVGARAHGWVSPHWNRLREGQPERR